MLDVVWKPAAYTKLPKIGKICIQIWNFMIKPDLKIWPDIWHFMILITVDTLWLVPQCIEVWYPALIYGLGICDKLINWTSSFVSWLDKNLDTIKFVQINKIKQVPSAELCALQHFFMYRMKSNPVVLFGSSMTEPKSS